MDPSSAEAGREKAWCMDTFNSLCSSYDYHRHINQCAKIACPCFWTLLFCPSPSPLLPLRNGLYHFWFIPRFCRQRGNGDGETNSSARGRWQQVPGLRIRKFSKDCQNAAAISRRRTHSRCVQFVRAAAKRRQICGRPKSAASSNLARYEVHYQLVDLAFELGHACKNCANKEGELL